MKAKTNSTKSICEALSSIATCRSVRPQANNVTKIDASNRANLTSPMQKRKCSGLGSGVRAPAGSGVVTSRRLVQYSLATLRHVEPSLNYCGCHAIRRASGGLGGWKLTLMISAVDSHRLCLPKLLRTVNVIYFQLINKLIKLSKSARNFRKLDITKKSYWKRLVIFGVTFPEKDTLR